MEAVSGCTLGVDAPEDFWHVWVGYYGHLRPTDMEELSLEQYDEIYQAIPKE